jgi:hypothetical protein
MTHLSVSEVARRLRCRPRNISDLFYQRLLTDERCPVVGGRLVPQDVVPAIKRVLRRLPSRGRGARAKRKPCDNGRADPCAKSDQSPESEDSD